MNKVNERSDEEEEEVEEDKVEKKEDNDEEEALMKAESVVVEKDTLASPNAQKSAASPSPSSLFSRFTSLLPALPSQLLVRALSPFASSLPSSPSLPQLMTAQEEEEPSRRTPRRRRHRSFAPCNGNGSASSSTYRGRYEFTQGTLYLFVHEIEALDSSSSSNSSYEAESVAVEALCLSLLAACPSISLVASASHLNVGLTWDSNMLKRFNWIFPCSASSFQPFEVNEHSLRGVVGTGKGAAGGSGATTSSFSSSSTQPVSDAAGANGVDYILQSLSMSHRELLSILCREHFRLKEEAKKTKTKSNEGKNKRQKTASSSSSCISFQEVYTICCNRMVVKNQADFSKLLKELTEQRIVTIADRSSGGNNNSDHRSRGGADGGGKIISLLLAEDIILQQVEGFHSLI